MNPGPDQPTNRRRSSGKAQPGPKPPGLSRRFLLAVRYLFLGVPLFLRGAEPGPAPNPFTLQVGYMPHAFLNLDRSESEAAFRVLAQLAAPRTHFDIVVKTAIYETEAEFETAIRAGEVDLAIIDATSYLTLGVREFLTPYFVASERGNLGKRYLLATRTDDALDTLAELHTKPKGKQTLTLFKLERLLPFQPTHLDSVARLLSATSGPCATANASSAAKADSGPSPSTPPP